MFFWKAEIYPNMEYGLDAYELATAFFLVYMLFFLCIGLAAYVLKAWGMYAIARRCGIHKPWLAWIPVADMWTLGCISDQYQYVTKGRMKSKRKILLTLTSVMYVAMAAVFVCYGVFAAQLFLTLGGADLDPGSAVVVLWMLIFYLVMLGCAIPLAVFQYMALYDLYRSCQPDNAVLYLVLTIVFGITMPAFVFACRKKDLGMPPRA